MKEKGYIRVLIAFSLALIVSSIFIYISGESPISAYYQLIKGAFFGKNSILTTLRWSVPYIIVGIAAAISLKAGVFNLGLEGCIYIGALTAALVGTYFTCSSPIVHVCFAILAAMVASAIWLIIPAYLKAYHKVNEVITTWMFTYIAILLTQYLVRVIFFDPNDIAQAAQQVRTPYIQGTAKLLELFPPYQLNQSIFIAVSLMVLFYIFVKKTKVGYEVTMLGKSGNFSKYGGVNIERTQFFSILISASIGGLLGACEVLGVHYRFIQGFSNDMGPTGIMVALIGQLNPIGVPISGIFMGALQAGARAMSRNSNVSLDTVSIMIAIVVIFVTAEGFYDSIKIGKEIKKHRKEKTNV